MQKRISTRTGTALPRPGIARAECYTREELAAQMGRSLITLSRWHRERKGPPCIVIGRLRLYPKRDFECWLAAHVINPLSR